MLSEQSRLFQRLFFAADLLLIAVGWLLAYATRFWLLHPVNTPFPELVAGLPWLAQEPQPALLGVYLAFLPGVVVVWGMTFAASGLYRGDRAQRITLMAFAVARAAFLGLLVTLAALFFYRAFSFSRAHMLLFGVYTVVMMVGLRAAVVIALRRAHARGEYLRRVLIVGAGRAGRMLERAFRQYPWMGFETVGFLDDHKTELDVLGTTDEAAAVADRLEADGRPLDYVYIALPLRASHRAEQVIEAFSRRLAHVCLVPDLLQYDLLNSRVTQIDGLPVIHVIDEAPMELQRYLKRAVDLAFSMGVLVVLSPLLLALALAVKLSSPGPVLYRQERMSLNGHRFKILKFRSMPVNVEKKSGAVWASAGEQRATRVGSFLRRTSLDELPQFWNVLKGEMSVVGPRPERPVFVQQFRDNVPGYMLRHKTKAGITGWAQVHGWRGDTSIEKRIEYDLYYIQHWSVGLDLKIMWMTVFKGFVHENAY